LKEKDQRELLKRPSDKAWKSKKKCKGVTELFYEEFVLEKKGVSKRKSLGEDSKSFSINVRLGSLYSLKKVLCTLIMVQGLVSRSRNLNVIDNLPLKLANGREEEFTAEAISLFPVSGS
jgi:hypothetical protein